MSHTRRPTLPAATAATLLLWLLLSSAAHAQGSLRALTEDSEQGYTPEETCKGAPLAGAESVHVVVRSNAEALLVGARGDRIVWKRKFPLRDMVNTPKTFPSCEGRKIELYSQLPFSAAAVVQTFAWDGRSLSFVSIRAEDPSAEYIERAVRAAETGDETALAALLKQTEEGDVDVMYPGAYINGYTLGEMLRRGRRAARGEFRAGRAREAARRLAMMFDVTVELAALIAVEAASAERPARWLEAWKETEVEAKNYLPALNDYGFYLQETGDHAAALAPLTAVVERDPRRTPARLNLADTLWALDRRQEARTHYEAYRRMMIAEGKAARIPARVGGRLR